VAGKKKDDKKKYKEDGDLEEAGKVGAGRVMGEIGVVGGLSGGVEPVHTWKLWRREDDMCLAEQVQQQIEKRGISHSVDIRWKDICVPQRLPNQSKERWR